MVKKKELYFYYAKLVRIWIVRLKQHYEKTQYFDLLEMCSGSFYPFGPGTYLTVHDNCSIYLRNC